MLKRFTQAVVFAALCLPAFVNAAGCPETNPLQGGFLSTIPVNVGGTPAGLHADYSGNLFISGATPSEVQRIQPDGTVLQSFVPSATPDPVAVLGLPGVGIYAIGIAMRRVDIYDLNGVFLSSFSVAAQASQPAGITYNPRTHEILVVDAGGTNMVSVYSLAGNFLRSHPIAGTVPAGITYDDARNTYWIYSIIDDMVRQYDANFTELLSFRGTVCYGLNNAIGLAVNAGTLYLMATNSNVIATFNISGVALERRVSGLDILESFNDESEEDSQVTTTLNSSGGGIDLYFLLLLPAVLGTRFRSLRQLRKSKR